MAQSVVRSPRKRTRRDFDPLQILQSLSEPVLVVDANGRISFVNLSAEEFFQTSASGVVGQTLEELLGVGNPIELLARRVAETATALTEYGLAIDHYRIGPATVSATISPLMERGRGAVVIALRNRTMADKLDRQLSHRHAARSVSAMAQMLAHEVRNPLSSIRGAAQLLEQVAAEGDRDLARLIRDEADRIRALVDRMDFFAEGQPLERGPVNIHSVLEHVRKAAKAGFARHIPIVERYDPSLPEVLGNRDQLVQVFLNLVKNAAEAVPEAGGEITLITRYQHGVQMRLAGTDQALQLPLQVVVQDNGPGVPADLQMQLFDPFVTTKHNGTGLGLALVAKVIGDHGGVVEFDSRPRRTEFRVSLPVYEDGETL